MHCSVALARCDGWAQQPYPEFPYAPDRAYPESAARAADRPNPVYDAVRRSLERLGLDRENQNTPNWNPLGAFIEPGQRVLVKPNWVFHERIPGQLNGMVTHSGVLRPVLDYVLLALKGRGRLIIGDAPLQSADFELLMEQNQARSLLEHIDTGSVDVEIRDFRENVCEVDSKGRPLAHHRQAGDPQGYCTVNLGTQSRLHPVSGRSEHFRVTNYDPAVMHTHHAPGRHEYLIARAVLESDVIINLPKLKTHRKAGLTCCLKNVVGINGSKDYLPHHRLGAVDQGGDEYRWPSAWKAAASRTIDFLEASPGSVAARLARLALRVCRRMAHHFARDPYSEGSWYGNDTIWRTIMDLNHVLKCARPDGALADKLQRQIFSIVDAVVVGGGEGPLRPDPVYAGMILAGETSAAVDYLAARLVGFDPDKIPLLKNAIEAEAADPQGQVAARLITDQPEAPPLAPQEVEPLLCLQPPAGWAGHVELAPCQPVDNANPTRSAVLSAKEAEE